ncbi:YjjW family glycine radical enzyme activase [Clostridium sp. PL3]|uniref:YjjW family glycine radical enzyme activase n=1 Tax=Clostridium thailandense TaxID=2794346 RepID=A0A949WVC5_9CLOT|nr:YjjW family glycine radical enzyme activase [Clostridium thailandense]MBV7273532.1 YjjW family glycine radical enzyme activase [Clostridium thailandense]
MLKGLVNKIIPFSLVDGPGNRTAIFFQGCNFNCLYCHNPETIKKCRQCGACVLICRFDAISIVGGSVIWDEEKCKDCGECIKSCPNDCGPKAKEMSVDEILKEITKVKSFISGITVSGGECTLQKEFLVDLFEEVRKLGLTIFVDTNGSTDFSKNKELVDLTDMVMLDIKSFDNDEHKKLTERDNDMVLKNARYLASINKLYEVRTVVVPNVLNNFNNVNEISKLIASLDNEIRYKLIKYRPIGVRTEKIEIVQPDNEMIEELKGVATRNGCKNVIVV